jgi:hypothetical protein
MVSINIGLSTEILLRKSECIVFLISTIIIFMSFSKDKLESFPNYENDLYNHDYFTKHTSNLHPKMI